MATSVPTGEYWDDDGLTVEIRVRACRFPQCGSVSVVKHHFTRYDKTGHPYFTVTECIFRCGGSGGFCEVHDDWPALA